MAEKKACLIFVSKSQHLVDEAVKKLSADGYGVCAVEASLSHATAAQAGTTDLPVEIVSCIENSEICVFLLPENPGDDEGLGGACTFANQMAKPVIGIVCGERVDIPQPFDDCAKSMIRENSNIAPAIADEVWENTDGSRSEGRTIKHIKCQ